MNCSAWTGPNRVVNVVTARTSPGPTDFDSATRRSSSNHNETRLLRNLVCRTPQSLSQTVTLKIPFPRAQPFWTVFIWLPDPVPFPRAKERKCADENLLMHRKQFKTLKTEGDAKWKLETEKRREETYALQGHFNKTKSSQFNENQTCHCKAESSKIFRPCGAHLLKQTVPATRICQKFSRQRRVFTFSRLRRAFIKHARACGAHFSKMFAPAAPRLRRALWRRLQSTYFIGQF